MKTKHLKQSFLNLIVIIITNLFFINANAFNNEKRSSSIPDGQPTAINFQLTSNSEPTTTGPIISLGESWSGMYAKGYSVPAKENVVWPEGVTPGITQRNLIIGDIWPAGEKDIVSSRYVQFGLKPVKGKTITLDSIGLYAGAANGNKLKYKIVMAKKADFSDAIILDTRTSNMSNTMYLLSYKISITIKDSECFFLRFYPWYNGEAATKYLCLRNLTISGVSK